VTPGSRGQIWTNVVEARGLEGVDDDANGYVDDVQGWDYVALPFGGDYSPGEDWRDEDNDPNDYVGHGTTVAGIAGAISDNQIGITGTARKVRLMPLRVGWSTVLVPTGLVDMSYVAQAVRYATLNGARVINISLSTTALLELNAAVSAALDAGVSVVLAAGNNGSPNGIPDFPALIQVTATDRNDVIPPWANVGAYVDFTAPGAAIPATNLRRTGTDSLGLRQPGYVADANGTSFAAPIASGALARRYRARAPWPWRRLGRRIRSRR
jgi:subtilisin family serine protease